MSGNYECLAGGLSSEAMTDFTGGVVERYTFSEELPENLFQLMLKARDKQSLMGCSIDVSFHVWAEFARIPSVTLNSELSTF